MRTFAIYLIFGAVALRGTVEITAIRDPTLTIILLAAYGTLLFTEPWLSKWLDTKTVSGAHKYHLVYVLTQIGLIMGLLLPGPTPDTFLALFIPLGLQVVLFFGWRLGFLWIGLFLITMVPYLVIRHKINNVIMALAFESVCFLVGSFAHLIQKADTVRQQNHLMAAELQIAQHQLEKYAGQVEELAAERFRMQLARELHDSVTQTVFSMNLAIQAARLTFQKDPSHVVTHFERLLELAKNAQSEIQQLVSQLKPQLTGGEDLVTGVKRLIAKHRAHDELEITLTIAGERGLSQVVVDGICNIVQETLTNVIKHADSRQATIRVDLANKPAWVEVEDKGIGFDPESTLSLPGHLGLTEMLEMAREIGWRLTMISRPSEGTLVHIEEDIQENLG